MNVGYYMRCLTTILALAVSCYATGQSVLSSGQWHKIGVAETGIYKIDRDFLVNQMDISVSGFNPKTLKIYGKGLGGMLPQPNEIARPSDPQQMAIWAEGEEDGTLDAGDYFLFYAEGPNLFTLDSLGAPEYQNNIYSDTAYYLITYGGEDGKRMTTVNTPAETGPVVNQFTDYIVHEEDLVNQLQSGRSWMGESFRRSQDTRQNFEYSITNPGSTMEAWVHAAASSGGPCSFDILLNGTMAGNLAIDSIANAVYNEKIKYASGHYQGSISDNKAELSLVFNGASGGVSTLGYLDFFILGIQRDLSLANAGSLLVRLPESGIQTMEIDGAESTTQIWEVTSPLNPQRINSPMAGGKVRFTSDGSQSTFIVFNGSGPAAPRYFHPVTNQNIKSLAGNEGIIITYPGFLAEANRLADFHRSFSGLTVGVVTPQQVYNEFSSGAQDLTAIRDFLRYCYLQGGTLKYVTLFGDASYDYKDRLSNNTNFVPVYESYESSHNIFSHSSDDYIGFFEEHEGGWYEGVREANSTKYIVPYDDHTLEVGIGRLPVKNMEEASTVVDKIIRYKTARQAYGKWRNQLAYFSDDGDNNVHMKHAEAFFQILDTTVLEYTVKKLYLDLYDQSVDAAESGALKAFENVIKEGVFMMNYIGHGNESQLTHENLITLTVIRKMTNRHKLPLFVTATCEFGMYDNPNLISGAERLLLNPNGGAIGLLTTTRPVYSHTNFPMNKALHENLFGKVNGRHPRLGDVIKMAKNESLSGPVNRNFSLLGDPMLTLNYPEHEISFDQLESEPDTLSALETYRLSGKVTSGGATLSSFSGRGVITLWDIPYEKVTKGEQNDPFSFFDQTNALYRGEVSVVDGFFDATFILPKNISYKYQPGKLTMYAWNDQEFIDASGASHNFVLGGTATGITEDNTPPRISIFLNDSTFHGGNTVGPSSLFIANLSDESGISISSNGFNQGLTLQLNDDEPILVNEFYTARLDNYKQGTILFPLQNLAPGNYTARLKVYDSHNNVAESTVQFKVSEKPVIRLFNALNYPNPVSQYGETTFAFEHDREDEELEVDLFLYNMEGRQVLQHSYRIDSSPRRVDNISIRTITPMGQPLDKGIYLYRLRVTSTLDEATNEVMKRLIIIN